VARIAIIQRFLPSRSRGGVGHFTHGLANALVELGHDVTVVTEDPAPDGARYTVSMLPPPSSALARRLSPLMFPFRLARQKWSGFDVIHAQGDEHLLPFGGPPVVRTLHGSALLEAFHNGWRNRSPKHFLLHLYFYACELIACLRASRVVAVSRETTRFYPRTHGVVPNGVDVRTFAEPVERKADHPVILFVGELHTRKRGRLLMEAFRAVRRNYPTAELWMVCPEEVDGAGVRWFTNLSTAALARLYRQAWVFCLPSAYEGFGRPYVEAMAAGTAVVATSNAGARDILDFGRYGIIARDKDLGAALCRLLGDPALRDAYAAPGRERAREYAWDVVAHRYDALYAELEHRSRNARSWIRGL
jgi:phosphatidylinositol alpha-mannosyltransferase